MFAACAEKKETTTTEDQEPVATEVADTTATAADTVTDAATAIEKPVDGAEITVKGKVTEINHGKDGYSAKLQGEDGKSYVATISIPNMADPKQYRSVNVGDVITVIGESHVIESDILIKVTKLNN